MIDHIRRNLLTTGAAATAIAAAQGVHAQPTSQGDVKFSFYEKGNVRIRYQETDSVSERPAACRGRSRAQVSWSSSFVSVIFVSSL